MFSILNNHLGATYSIDAEEGMAYVSGIVDPQKLLMRLVSAGKEAELCWVRTGSDHGNNAGFHQYPSGSTVGYYQDPRYRDPYFWDASHRHGYYNSYYEPHYYYPYASSNLYYHH